MPYFLWSTNAASNATVDPTINWAEGMPPSAVNNSARAMMAALAANRNDISGSIAGTGSGTAYAVTSFSSFDTLAHLDNQIVAFRPGTTNTGPVTLSVDGLTAKPIRSAPGVDLGAGTLVQGTPYTVIYSNGAGEFYVFGLTGNPYNVPLGGMMPFVGSIVPNSSFAFPFGQAISRTTYAGLFALTGTAYGVGDGSTTFNIPDVRGRAVFGLDNMGGSAANRVTSAGSGINGVAYGAAGGAENHTLTIPELPTVTPAGTVSKPTITTTVSQNLFATLSGGTGGANFYAPGSNPIGLTAASSLDATPTFTGTPFGSGTAHPIMPPAIILPLLLRIF